MKAVLSVSALGSRRHSYTHSLLLYLLIPSKCSLAPSKNASGPAHACLQEQAQVKVDGSSGTENTSAVGSLPTCHILCLTHEPDLVTSFCMHDCSEHGRSMPCRQVISTRRHKCSASLPFLVKSTALTRGGVHFYHISSCVNKCLSGSIFGRSTQVCSPELLYVIMRVSFSLTHTARLTCGVPS